MEIKLDRIYPVEEIDGKFYCYGCSANTMSQVIINATKYFNLGKKLMWANEEETNKIEKQMEVLRDL